MEVTVGQAVDTKEIRKVFSRLGGIFLAGAVVSYVLAYGILAILNAVAPDLTENSDLRLLLSSVSMYGVGMPIIILLARRLPANAPMRRSVHPGHFAVAVFICYSITFFCNIIGNIITLIIGLLKGGMVQNNFADATIGVSPWLLLFDVVICAPVIEEYVFRRLLLDRIVCYGQGVAILVSGLMFGLFHGNLNQFAYACVIGMFLAFLYVKTGNLKVTIGIHMAINLIGSLAVLLVQQLDMEEYLRLAERSDVPAMMNYITQNLGAWIGLFVFLGIDIAIVIMGAVFFIVSLAYRKYTLDKSLAVIPGGERFRTVIWNVGMALYCVFWIGVILWQLFR